MPDTSQNRPPSKKPTTKKAAAKKTAAKAKTKKAAPKKTKAAPKAAKPSSAPQEQAQNDSDPGSVLGQVAWLMMQSPAHKHLFLNDLEWLVLTPIMHGQLRLFQKDGKPVAAASWAFVSEEVEQRLLNGQHRLSPMDWKSGDKPWLIDLVAPFGGGEEIVASMSKQIFKGETFKAVRPNPDGPGIQVINVGAAAA